MANFFTQFLKSFIRTKYGDYECMVNGRRKRLIVTAEKNQAVAYVVGGDEFPILKSNIASVEQISKRQMVNDLRCYMGKDALVNVYQIQMKNGETAILRLLTASEYKVLTLLK